MALALVSARYPQPSRIMRMSGLGRDINKRLAPGSGSSYLKSWLTRSIQLDNARKHYRPLPREDSLPDSVRSASGRKDRYDAWTRFRLSIRDPDLQTEFQSGFR